MSLAAAQAFITDAAGSTSAQDVRDSYAVIYADNGNVGNMWKISKTASQTLTNATNTTITFDRADIDGGGSVIDLANNRLTAPATGFYMAFVTWMWESTVPGVANMGAPVNGTVVAPLSWTESATKMQFGSLTGVFPMSLVSGDHVTLIVNPGAVTGATARGNSGTHVSTHLTLVRIT